jgi:acetate---CoA ligase (ADP-forming)
VAEVVTPGWSAPVANRLDAMFGARSVALVGASPRPGSVGAVTLDQLIDGGFSGEVWPVNPRHVELRGRRCFPSLAEVPGPVDLAIIAVPDGALLEQVQQAAHIGARAAVVFGGFSAVAVAGLAGTPSDASGTPSDASGTPTDPGGTPSGASGTPLAERLGRIADGAEMVLCGPNCMGFVDLERQLRACAYLEPLSRRPGPIALISHSGSVFSALLHNDRGLEFNLAVSAGQEASVTAADYLDYALDRDSTRVVALFLETVRDPTGFRAALEKAGRRDIPVVALKVGGSPRARDLVQAHSGGLAGDDGAYEALFDAYGVARVRSLDEMADTLELFAAGRSAGPGGLATVHDSGGERAHLADVAADEGVPFAVIGDRTRQRLARRLDPGLVPTNPLDAWGSGRDFAAAFHDHAMALHDDDATSVVALALDLTTETDPTGGYLWTARTVMEQTTKPVAVIANLASGIDRRDAVHLRESGVPVLQGTRTGMAAIRHLLRRRDVRARPPIIPTELPADDLRERWRHRLAAGGGVGEAEALALLRDYGVPVVNHRRADGIEAVLAAGADLGWPVVMKTAMPGIEHKSDVGGVRLGIRDPEELRDAYDDLRRRLGPAVVIAPMASPGTELMVGMVADPQLGPIIVVAAGGTLTELLRDRRVALPPLDRARARDLLDGLTVRPSLDGVRGRAAADLASVEDAIVRVAALAEDLGDVLAAVDVNPLVAGPDGCLAVDALVVPRA